MYWLFCCWYSWRNLCCCYDDLEDFEEIERVYDESVSNVPGYNAVNNTKPLSDQFVESLGEF